MSTPFTTTNANTNANVNANVNLKLTAHITAVQEATEIIKNAYRFIEGGEAREHIHYLCATVQDHIDTITISPEVPSQMRSYEMALESVREFTLIPEGATPIETADILKDMLAPPELNRSRAGVVYNISQIPKNIIDIRSTMSPPLQNEEYCLAPRKLFPEERDMEEDNNV